MKYVYIVKAANQQYKVGVAYNVTKRLASLQTGNGNQIDLVCARLCSDPTRVERQLHALLRPFRTKGEWFQLSNDQVIDLCVTLNEQPEAKVADYLLERLTTKFDHFLASFDAPVKPVVEVADRPTVSRDALRARRDADLVVQAKKVFEEEGRMSTSLLQRKLGLGYGRAARIHELIRLS